MAKMKDYISLIKESIIDYRYSENTKIKKMLPFFSAEDLLAAKDTLFICKDEDAEMIASSGAKDISILVCTNKKDFDSSVFLGTNINYAVSNLYIHEAANTLFKAYNRYNDFKRSLNSIIATQGGIDALIREAVNFMDSRIHIYVLSSTFQVLASCTPGTIEPKIFSDRKLKKDLDDGQLRFITKCLEGNESVNYSMHTVYDKEDIVGYIMVIAQKDVVITDLFISALSNRIAGILCDSYRIYSKDQIEMQKLLTDMLLLAPDNAAPLISRLHSLKYPLKEAIRFLIVSKENQNEPIWPLCSDLEELFPKQNITAYDGYIIVIFSGDSFLFRPKFSSAKLNSFLVKNNAYAFFTIPARFIRGIRTGYIQAKELLPKLPFIINSDKMRFAYFEDYYNYYRIHLSAVALQQQFGHSKIAYLIHPLVAQILKYDSENGTNYFNFLYTFSICNGSINEAADMLGVHRNTINNKIKKAEALFSVNFTDNNIQNDLILAKDILKYYNVSASDIVDGDNKGES